MELKVRAYINKLSISIKDTEIIIERHTQAINQLRGSIGLGIEYVTLEVEKRRNIIKDKTDLLVKLKEEYNNIKAGIYISLNDIERKYDEDQIVTSKKQQEGEKKKKNKRKDVEDKKKVFENYKILDKKEYSHYKQKDKDIRYGWKHFNRAVDSLPFYMQKNLNEMPGNKGYIWKGVYFYGKLADQPYLPVVIFEKCNKDLLIIHETTPTEYKKYQKNGQNRKELIFKGFRKNKQTDFCLLNYIKK
jgi:hypothetical protein